MEEHSIHSSFREKLIEHLFVGELLKIAWINNEYPLEVSKPEVDNSGYDLIIEAKGILRHIQLKATFKGAKTSRQKVHISLANKPSGCIVWVFFDKDNLALGPFRFFGGKPGEPLPELSDFGLARHTKGNADGFKSVRPNIRTINKDRFETYKTIEDIYHALFK